MSTNITPNGSMAEQIKAMHRSMIKGQANAIPDQNADPQENIELKDISIKKEDLLLFKSVPDNDDVFCHEDLIEKTSLQTNLLNVLKGIFADVQSVNLAYYGSYNKWVFQIIFFYLTDDAFQQICRDSGKEAGVNLFRALDSKINTIENSGSSVGQTLLALNNNQMQSTVDASKYTSFTQDAKKYLSTLIFTNGDKKPRWVKDHNYKTTTITNTGYNGQQIRNLAGMVVLDAAEVLTRFCAIKENWNKYDFVLADPTEKMNGFDTMFKVKMYNKRKRTELQTKYGIQFNF